MSEKISQIHYFYSTKKTNINGIIILKYMIYFKKYKDKDIVLLEVGVHQKMWSYYFGRDFKNFLG